MKKETATTIIVIVMFALFFGVIGWTLGLRQGVMMTWEQTKESDCRVEYSMKPLNEVPVKCLKYFDLPEKK